MIEGITILLLFQWLGEAFGYLSGGLIPGPVIGMAMIAILFTMAKKCLRLVRTRRSTTMVSSAILANLGVLFVPAGVGIVQHLDIIRDRGLALLAIIILSTALTLTVRVWVFIAIKKLTGGTADD
jgi:holin-like protein